MQRHTKTLKTIKEFFLDSLSLNLLTGIIKNKINSKTPKIPNNIFLTEIVLFRSIINSLSVFISLLLFLFI